MEWNRGPAQTQPANQPAGHTPTAHSPASKSKGSLLNLRVASVVLLFCITILMVAIVSVIALGETSSQNQHVDKSKMQAVFLNGGQVYFGKIDSSNEKFMRVNDIYYLRVNQQVQPDGAAAQNANQDISLVKLGCELHGPQDSMVINQGQIIFWENLKEDGQVAQAVKKYKTDNPNGQKCDAAPANGSGSTTPATTPTTAKPPTPAATPTPTTPATRRP